VRPDVVLVSGPCRSGSAAVAEVVHVLGWPMGSTFLAPVAPDFRFDWEDAELTLRMGASVMCGRDPLDLFDFHSYVKARLEHSKAFCVTGQRFGMKSGLFCIGATMGRIECELAAMRLRLFVIAVRRPKEAVEASIARQPGASVMRRWNAAIEESGPHPYDYEIDYDRLVRFPSSEVALLAARLGVDDPVAVSEAAIRVVIPRS